jgi:hypothetical protein
MRRTFSRGFDLDSSECNEILASQSTMTLGEEKGARIGKEFTIRTRFQEGHVFFRRGKLPAAGHATPMTYQIDGKQYLVIAAGGHAKIEQES